MINLRNIKTVSGLMAAAMLVLVLIQGFWLYSAIKSGEELFNDKVSAILANLGENLKKGEVKKLTFRKLKPSSANKNIDTLIQDNEGKNIQIKIHSSEKETGGKKEIRSETRIAIINNDHDSLPKKHVSEWVTQNKEKLMIDVMEEIDFVGVPIQERFTKSQIDSVMSVSLAKAGLTISFVSVLSDKKNKENSFSTNLHDNQPFLAPYYYSVEFPNKHLYFLKSVWWLVLISLLIIGMVAYVFFKIVSIAVAQKKLVEIKNDFIANMTHELKTPIATILLAGEALNDESYKKDEEVQKRYLKLIETESKRLDKLVENVLQSSLSDEADYVALNAEIDLVQMLSGVCNNTGLVLQNRAGSIQLTTELSSAIMKGNAEHLQNIFLNLIDNAIKYCEKSPVITIDLKQENNTYIVTITDNGIGIEEKNIPFIFDKFYRIPTGNLHNVKGYGLGLSYVKNIVEAHKGNIRVKSTLHTGSTFTLQFPAN